MRNKEEARRLLAVPFALTRGIRAPESGLRRLRTHDAGGRHAWTFDAVINFRAAGSDGDTVADNYSAAVVELPVRFDARIGLERRGFLRRPESLSAPEVEAGTDELRERYSIRATDPELAERLLDAGVCEWLTGRPGRGFHYEIVHDRVLAYGWRRYLGGRGPLRAALGLAQSLG
jgi:hypothetical protein